MSLDRRTLLARTGLALAAAGLGERLWASPEAEARPAAPPTWAEVRRQLALDPTLIQLGGFLLATHPAPVRAAIERHRRGLDRNPVDYLHEREAELEAAVLRDGAAYLGVSPLDLALTDSTTMGLGLVYNGLRLNRGDEVVTTRHDFFATHQSLATAAARTGASVRTISLYDRPQDADEGAIVAAVRRAIGPRTRALAVTWVHSSTGVKLPLRRIADALAEVNRGRAEDDRVLLCVDAVHGLAAENVRLRELGCDVFVAGCHKWLLGPRGTGIVWASPRPGPACSRRSPRSPAAAPVDPGSLPAASTPSSIAGPWRRPSPSSGGSAKRGPRPGSTRSRAVSRRVWPRWPTSPSTRPARRRYPRASSASTCAG
ncbi:MAG: aminotransferase class V-fold PLP-dependent enzyme [Gaiellaceae bacterium]